MRDTFIQELVNAARAGKDLVLVVGDLGYKVIEPFADEFPNQFFNAGVAEQNMMGLAAGMASEGVHVFVYSIANFPTFRCAEQVRNDVDYHNFPVTIVSVGGGLAYGNLGYSHHAVQDYALMRSMPNMLIAAPGDPMEVRGCMNYLISNPSPSYLRLGKAGEASLHENVPNITPGAWLKVGNFNPESKKTILTTGGALEIGYQLLNKDFADDVQLHSLPLWGMRNKVQQIQNVARWEEVITVEDHLLDGGFSSWMLESLAEHKPELAKITPRSLNERVCGAVGTQKTLNRLGGLI